eukprot:436248_1
MACICSIVSLTCYSAMILALLATLLVRLKYTFDHSVYALSTHKCILSLVLFLSTSICFILTITCYTLWVIGHISINFTLTFFMTITAHVLYIITGIWAVAEFSQKLLNLTKLQARSSHNMNDHIELNQSQKKLVHQIARYNALFALGTAMSVSSLIGLILTFAVALNKGERSYSMLASIIHIFISIHSLGNVICLYLQYSFATKHYQKYCKCLDLCWKNIFSRKAMQLLKSEYHNTSTDAVPEKRANSDSETDTESLTEPDDVKNTLI